jgi:hypothetical protein
MKTPIDMTPTDIIGEGPCYTAGQAAALLGCSVQQVRRSVNGALVIAPNHPDGQVRVRLKRIMFGKTEWYSAAHLKAFLTDCQAACDADYSGAVASGEVDNFYATPDVATPDVA